MWFKHFTEKMTTCNFQYFNFNDMILPTIRCELKKDCRHLKKVTCLKHSSVYVNI